MEPRTASPVQGEGFRREASRRLNKELTLVQSSRYWFCQGLKFIKENPGQWIKLQLRKFLLFWSSYERPTNINYAFARKHIRFFKLPLVTFGLIAPLGLAGILFSYQKRHVLLMILYLFSYLLSILSFFVLSEYRYPVASLFTVFSGWTLYTFYAHLKQKKNRKFFSTLLTTGLLFCLVNFNTTGKEKNALYTANAYNDLGVAYYKKGMYGKALESFKKSISSNQAFSEAYANLSQVYRILGLYGKAMEYIQKAINIQENYPKYHILKGELYHEQRLLEEALRSYQDALSFNPDLVDAYNRMGLIRMQQGRIDEARGYFKKALEMNPSSHEAKSLLKKISQMKSSGN